jgi:DNA-directed RNA polymerase subunit beta'
LAPDKESRDKVLNAHKTDVEKIHKLDLPQAEKDRRLVELYMKASKEIQQEHLSKPRETHLNDLLGAGVKPTMDQYKQMVLAPMLMMDSRGQVIPTPITKSYAEGMDLAGYWIGSHGARRGAVRKVQEVQEPGYLSKLLVNTTMDQLVAAHDCGTTRGMDMSVQDKAIHDRHLARPFTQGNLNIPAGTLLTPTVVGQIRAVDKNATIAVRSPLKCEHEKGICQKCAGVYPDGKHPAVGTNVGVLAAQSIGERATQLTLKEFHTGGVAGAQGKATNLFARFQQLTQLPQKIPNTATIAMVPGTIQHIEKDSTGTKIVIDGHVHHVGKDATGNSLAEHLPDFVPTSSSKAWEPPKVGMRVRPGDTLSDPNRTFVNPHDLYKATGNINKVQNHLVTEMAGIYKDEKIDQRHVELLVRAMSGVTKVNDPGDHPEMLRGEFRPTWEVQRVNKELLKQNKQPINHSPVLKGISELPLLTHDDWLAKLQHKGIRSTLMDAAARGARSNLHGPHPIPGLAYGAEFGLNKGDALKPGMSHLRDVEGAGY